MSIWLAMAGTACSAVAAEAYTTSFRPAEICPRPLRLLSENTAPSPGRAVWLYQLTRSDLTCSFRVRSLRLFAAPADTGPATKTSKTSRRILDFCDMAISDSDGIFTLFGGRLT